MREIRVCTIAGMCVRCRMFDVSCTCSLCANYLFITLRLHGTVVASSLQTHCILCGGPAAKCSSLQEQAGFRDGFWDNGVEFWVGLGVLNLAGFSPALQTAINLVELHSYPPQWIRIRPNQFPIGRVMWLFLLLIVYLKFLPLFAVATWAFYPSACECLNKFPEIVCVENLPGIFTKFSAI